MAKLGWRVRLKGTHITGDVQHKEGVEGAMMCLVWWDAAPHPDHEMIDASALESVERRPGGQASHLYDPNPPSKAQQLQSQRKRQDGHRRV